jgi:hypothetical protein
MGQGVLNHLAEGNAGQASGLSDRDRSGPKQDQAFGLAQFAKPKAKQFIQPIPIGFDLCREIIGQDDG